MRRLWLHSLSIGVLAACLFAAQPVAVGTASGEPPALATESAAPPPPPPQEKPKRAAFTAQDEARAAIPGIANARFWADDVSAFTQAMPTAKGPWIALSGGGEDGAFGAGFLTGWTEAGDRPEFAMVTGVSTGALMAPFVFLGPRLDDELRRNYTTITSADVFEVGSTPESMLDTWPLKKLIEKQVTPDLLRGIATESRKGRRLLVLTMNLDAGRQVAWDMGAIAERGDDSALNLFRALLLASSSIPGVFPPVYMDVDVDGRRVREMHSDGTINAPFYVAPAAMLSGDADVALPASELYVVANTRLAPNFELVEPGKLAILGRSISLALKAGVRLEVARTQAAADRLGIDFRLIAVPPSFTTTARGSFDSKYMSALFDLGQRIGRQHQMRAMYEAPTDTSASTPPGMRQEAVSLR